MGWIWQNGALRAEQDVRIDPADRGLLLGDGLFETMRAQAGRVPHLDRHLARLTAGADLLGLPLDHDRGVLDAAIRALLQALAFSDAALRLTLTRGPGPRGLAPPEPCTPMLMIRAFPLAPSPPEPARAITGPIPRNERSPVSGVKSLNCLEQILCARAAREAGCHEAVLLNTQGRLACATTANLFLVQDGIVRTPDRASGILPGIARGRLLDAMPIVEQPLGRDELVHADEAFLTNSLIGARPLVELDGQPIGNGQPGPLTAKAAALLA